MSSTLLNWPEEFDRTPEHRRESTSKFSVGYQRTRKELRREFDRMGVDSWRLDDVQSRDEPGIVVRWEQDGVQYAVACDQYTSKKDNIREIYLWINETRMRSDRPVETGQDDFAAAKLPPGGETGTGETIVADEPPHEILGVDPDATVNEIRTAYREKLKHAHPDSGGSGEELQRLREAKDRMLS